MTEPMQSGAHVSQQPASSVDGSHMAHAIEAVSDAVFLCAEDTLEVCHVNRGAIELHGYTKSELLSGMTPMDLAPSIDPVGLAEMLSGL